MGCAVTRRKGTFAHTADRGIFIPEVQFDSLPPGAIAEPLRGCKFSRAVMLYGKCVGWILVENLGGAL